MPVFVWEGKTAQGKMLKGEMEALNQQAVLSRLRSQRIQPNPTRVREKGTGLDKELALPGFRAKVKPYDVMIYPATIVFVAAAVVSVLLIYVIPVFGELYGSMGKALPAPTQITINVSNWFRAYIIYLVAGVAAMVFAIRAYYKTENGKLMI